MTQKQARAVPWARFTLIALQLLFIVAVPTFLVTLSLRIALNSPRLYAYGFDHYDVTLRTGLPREDLVRAGNELIAYFNSSQENLAVVVDTPAGPRELFNGREVTHMRDVKGLVRGVYRWQWISLGYLLGFGLVGGALWRRRFWPVFARCLLWGSGFTIVALLVVGLAVAVGFDALFTQFHLLSFSNDFWQLDPRTDKLIQMFPEPFWQTATLFVGLEAIVGALVLGSIAALFLRRSRKPMRLWSAWRRPLALDEAIGSDPRAPAAAPIDRT